MITRRGFVAGLGALIAAPAIVKASSIWIPPRRPLKIAVPYLWGGKLMAFERDQLWSEMDSMSAYVYSDELSDILRREIEPFSKFRQLAELPAFEYRQ